MGGGDLNLKKSWHPQTLRNVEKVWKAEQKHEAERKKIEELQRELQEERAREEMQRRTEHSGRTCRGVWIVDEFRSCEAEQRYLNRSLGGAGRSTEQASGRGFFPADLEAPEGYDGRSGCQAALQTCG